MRHRITLIPGDGIGPEVASAVVRIIEASGVEIEWEEHLAGQLALDKYGKTLPDELIESIKRNRVGLKGPITTPVGKGFTSVNVGLRKALDLYANLRPVRALPNVPRSEEHTSELQSLRHLVCRLLLEKKKASCIPRTAPTAGWTC